jgi:hypothetical protein
MWFQSEEVKVEVPQETEDSVRDRLEILQSLLDHPGWHVLLRVMKEQLNARAKELGKPFVTVDDALKHNYALGIIHGIRNTLIMPHSLKSVAEEAWRGYLHGTASSNGESYDPLASGY